MGSLITGDTPMNRAAQLLPPASGATHLKSMSARFGKAATLLLPVFMLFIWGTLSNPASAQSANAVAPAPVASVPTTTTGSSPVVASSAGPAASVSSPTNAQSASAVAPAPVASVPTTTTGSSPVVASSAGPAASVRHRDPSLSPPEPAQSTNAVTPAPVASVPATTTEPSPALAPSAGPAPSLS